MTKQERQTQHTLSKDDKTVDQVKVQSVKDFELTVVVCDRASNSSKQMAVSSWPDCCWQPCCFEGYFRHPLRELTLELDKPSADVD